METEACDDSDEGGGGVFENTLERVRELRSEGETEREAERELPGKASVELERDARENIFPMNEFARDAGPFFEPLLPTGIVEDFCEFDQ